MNVPEPETQFALLTHARTGEWVWHRYLATVSSEIPDKPYTEEIEGKTFERMLKGGPIWQFIFESMEHDPELRAQRVWGYQGSAVQTEASA